MNVVSTFFEMKKKDFRNFEVRVDEQVTGALDENMTDLTNE